MNIVRWNPWREMETLHHINRIFDDSSVSGPGRGTECRTWRPVVDVYENGKGIVIKADLPGMDKDHVEVDLKDDVLTIKGERSYDHEVKDDKFYLKERSLGTFLRRFTVPGNIDAGKINAEFKDGVLTVEVPKPEELKPKQITVH